MTDFNDPRFQIAASASPEARAKLEKIRALLATLPKPIVPRTLAEFDAAAERGFGIAEQLARAGIDALGPTVIERSIDTVTVLDVTPRDHVDDGSAIVYIHGGGFVQGSARSSLLTATTAAQTSGRRVLSIDYTLAPRGTWQTITDQVARVWASLLQEGRAPEKTGLFGDSAGACIAAASSLLIRERSLPLPAALILLSPVVDFAIDGDTTGTLAAVDYLDATMRQVAREAYAPGADFTGPLVSPIYGDFAPGYPPVLIQVGTREMLLSDSVRFHRALRAAGRSSRLEVYEGMPHVFQSLLADTPEGRAAWAEMAEFWTEHLT